MPRAALRKLRVWQQGLEAGADVGNDHRQHGQLFGGKRSGECAVIGVLTGGFVLIGFRQNDVEANSQRIGTYDPVQQLGMQPALPWPAPEFADTVIVNGDDNDIVACRSRVGAHELIRKGSVLAAKTIHVPHATISIVIASH